MFVAVIKEISCEVVVTRKTVVVSATSLNCRLMVGLGWPSRQNQNNP